MDNRFIPVWIKKLNVIEKICNNQEIPYSEIIPLHFDNFKGSALINTKSKKYVVKWNENLSYAECRFQMDFTNWFNGINKFILPTFMNFNDELYIDKCFYFIYNYIEGLSHTNYYKCAQSIATFHEISKEYNNDYYESLGLASVKTWLNNLINTSICLVDNSVPIIETSFDLDLTKYIAVLKNYVNRFIKYYDENDVISHISICHGDLNLKNFIYCKDGSCRIIDLDTLSYSLKIRDLFGFLKSLCINSKENVAQCLIEYDKSCIIDEIECDLLYIMCNPIVNLYYLCQNTVYKNDSALLRNYIYGMSQVFDTLKIIGGAR